MLGVELACLRCSGGLHHIDLLLAPGDVEGVFQAADDAGRDGLRRAPGQDRKDVVVGQRGNRAWESGLQGLHEHRGVDLALAILPGLAAEADGTLKTSSGGRNSASRDMCAC